MRAVFKAPGERAHAMVVPNDLHTIQDLVGGYIETVTIPVTSRIGNEKGLIIICDEEGKLKEGVQPNFWCLTACDEIYGPVLVVGADGEDFGSLTDHDVDLVLDKMNIMPNSEFATCL